MEPLYFIVLVMLLVAALLWAVLLSANPSVAGKFWDSALKQEIRIFPRRGESDTHAITRVKTKHHII